MVKSFKIAICSLLVFGGLSAGCGKKDKKTADKNKLQKTDKKEVKQTQKKQISHAKKQQVENITRTNNSHEGSANFSGQSEGK